jgi:hypothetical protein
MAIDEALLLPLINLEGPCNDIALDPQPTVMCMGRRGDDA